MWGLVLYPFIYLAGGAVAVGLSATRFPSRSQHWWWAIFGAAALSASVSAALSLSSLMNDGALYRDVAAEVAMSVICPLVVGAVISAMRQRSWQVRLFTAVAIFGVFALALPSVVLYVHCTSGDCI